MTCAWSFESRSVSQRQTHRDTVERRARWGGTWSAVTVIGLRIGDGAGKIRAGHWTRLRAVRIWGRGLSLGRRGDGGVRRWGGALGRQFAVSMRIATGIRTEARWETYDR